MNISVCITTLNEEGSITSLLEGLLHGSKKPNEIVIVDAGSSDRTVEIIRHFQKKDSRIKMLIEKGASRAKGRNLGVEIAKGEIIAMTDGGCIPLKNWLENLTEPFAYNIDVVAGFYKMTGNSSFEKAESYFLGITPKRFNLNFLPSTRSIAFTKQIWEKVGGFPENLKGAAEDTIFNYKLLGSNAKISRVKNAIVEWGMPQNLNEFFVKVFNYAKGDSQTKIYNFPTKHFTSHNIKAIFVILRYLAGLVLMILSFNSTPLLFLGAILMFLYIIWAYRKVYLDFGEYRIAIYGPVLQITSDLAVMAGFIAGLFGI